MLRRSVRLGACLLAGTVLAACIDRATVGDDMSLEEETGAMSDPQVSCVEFCQAGCWLEDGFMGCVEECEYFFDEFAADNAPQCGVAFSDYMQCMDVNECNEAACPDARTLEDECGCAISFEPTAQGLDCDEVWTCYGVEKRISCVDGECLCYEDSRVTGSCDNSVAEYSVCDSVLIDTRDFAVECCGFDDYPQLEL